MSNVQRKAGCGILGAAALFLAAGITPAVAFEIDTGNPDVKVRFDNTLRYNLGMRAEGQDSRITSSPNFDESDRKFDRGDLVSNRLDILSEFDASYQDRMGIRLSGSFWYDNAYQDTDVSPNPALRGFLGSYVGNRYSSDVRRYYRGPSGELLDAFAYGRINAGEVPVDIKAGRHTIYWGEGLLFGAHAISYSQAPQDGRKAVSSPGIETKEVFLPLAQVSGKAQITEDLSIAGQYFLEWKPTRTPAGGTYLSASDLLLADRLAVGGNRALPRLGALEPKNIGNWGVNARYNANVINSTVGLYYRQFDDYTPLVQTLPTGYRFVYAKDVKLYGLSLATNLFGSSAGFEMSYRQNGPLNSSSISALDNKGARGDTFHAVANGVWILGGTALYDTGNLAAEVAYSRLIDVTHNSNLYKGKGYGGCVGQGASDGCSTRNFMGVAVNFTPQWLQVAPSLDIELPLTVNYSIFGNAPSAGSSGNQGTFTYSLGVRAIYAARHELTLRYADQHSDGKYANNILTGGNGSPSLNDRGYVSLTYKVGF